MTLWGAIILLFLVMDPVGNVPLFLTALRRVAPHRRRYVLVRELLIALGIMIIFLFLGRALLQTLQVSDHALTVAGGVLLLLIAIRMIFPSPERPLEERVHADEPFIVPLAVPYTAGPSLLATEILLMSQDGGRWAVWLAAISVAWLASAIILYSSSLLERILGTNTLVAIERLMGMVLVIVSVQMLLSGIRGFFLV